MATKTFISLLLLTRDVSTGIYGIAASKFYLDAHPKCRLAVLEQDRCPGGSWSSSKTLEIWDHVCVNRAMTYCFLFSN